MGTVLLALASGPSWHLLLPFDIRKENESDLPSSQRQHGP